MDEVLESYASSLRALDIGALVYEYGALVSVQPRFAPHLRVVVEELQSRNILVKPLSSSDNVRWVRHKRQPLKALGDRHDLLP